MGVNGKSGQWYIQDAMSADGGQRDPMAEELAHAQRTNRRLWMLQWLRIPDFAELAGGWADLPRGGRWVIVALVVGVIMLVPAAGMVVALLG